jgi:hypothetical protein
MVENIYWQGFAYAREVKTETVFDIRSNPKHPSVVLF